jgi:hypothetical protein
LDFEKFSKTVSEAFEGLAETGHGPRLVCPSGRMLQLPINNPSPGSQVFRSQVLRDVHDVRSGGHRVLALEFISGRAFYRD